MSRIFRLSRPSSADSRVAVYRSVDSSINPSSKILSLEIIRGRAFPAINYAQKDPLQTFSNAGSNVFSFLLGARKRRGRSGDHWSRIFRQQYPFYILLAPHGIQKKYRHAPEVLQLEKVFVFHHQ